MISSKAMTLCLKVAPEREKLLMRYTTFKHLYILNWSSSSDLLEKILEILFWSQLSDSEEMYAI